jgi:two-component system, sensor histidine kinase and response regulator
MIGVMVYSLIKGIKKKVFQILPLLKEYNFYFLADSEDFSDDLNSVKPEYLILEAQTFETLKDDRACFDLILRAGCKLIIIGEIGSAINLSPEIQTTVLSPEFGVEELKKALDLTDRPEPEVADSELQFEMSFSQMLMDNFADIIYFKDNKLRFTRINHAKARSLGIIDPGEAIGKTDADYIDPVQAKKAMFEEQELMKTGIPVLNKLERIESGGRSRFVIANKLPVKDKTGRIVGMVGISRDVTESKEHEEQLMKEQYLLKALMDNIPDKIFFKDRKSQFIRVNKAWAAKHNLVNTDDVIGKADADYFNQSFAEETFREEQSMMETSVPLINKLEKKVREDGRESFKLVTKVPFRDKNGKIAGLVGISHDITDLKLAENKLAREKELLQSLMDNIPDLIYFKDLESKFTRINHAQAEFLGIKSPDEAIGKSDFDFFPAEQAELIYKEEQEVLKHGSPMINYLEKIIPPGGSAVWMSATKIPIKDEMGNITGLVGVSRDVTLMEETRENLKYAKEKAEEANFAKSQFLANMSHEIRTPMNGVIGMADILRYTSLTPEQQSYLDIIIKSGNSLISIINDILDLSKIESDNLSLEKAPISIRSIMEDVADILIVAANNKNIELANYVDPLIPDIVEGDTVRVRQILINLVNNAIKFTPGGEVFFSAELEESNKNGYKLLFKVIDSGIGISKNAQSSLFLPFTQVDNSATRKYEGTGLGLSISKKLAEMMGGAIGVESEEGKGSLFWFTAWFGIAVDVEPVTTPNKLLIEGLNVLIVDDNKTNRFIFGKYLETWNCHHEEAGEAKAALEMMTEAAMKGRPFDIALLDYQMAGMDGFELANMIRANPLISETLLILLSSVSDIILPNQVMQKGFNSFLNKPVKLKDLYSVISTVTGNKEVKRALPKHRKTETSRKLRILIAEDNLINARVAQIIVKPFASLIETEVNGQLAFDKFRTAEYDAILMDLQMPELDGYKATELIREYERSTNRTPVKIIAMTANAMKEDVDHCMSIGMDGYLSKPFRREDMIRVLKNAGLLDVL